MSDIPERVWVWRVTVPDHPYPAGSLEYIRADAVQAQIDAAVKAERERCAKVAETRVAGHWGPWVAKVILKGDHR